MHVNVKTCRAEHTKAKWVSPVQSFGPNQRFVIDPIRWIAQNIRLLIGRRATEEEDRHHKQRIVFANKEKK